MSLFSVARSEQKGAGKVLREGEEGASVAHAEVHAEVPVLRPDVAEIQLGAAHGVARDEDEVI